MPFFIRRHPPFPAFPVVGKPIVFSLESRETFTTREATEAYARERYGDAVEWSVEEAESEEALVRMLLELPPLPPEGEAAANPLDAGERSPYGDRVTTPPVATVTHAPAPGARVATDV